MRASRFLVTLAVGLVCSLAAGSPAFAQILCTNDTDCPGARCGSSVCQWTVAGHSCVAAGTDPEGFDGWCTADSNCKCVGFGATCTTSSHCTFTLSQDAGAVATSSSGSSSGSTTTAPGAAGCSMGGSARGARWAHGYAALAGVALAGLALARRRHRRQQEVA